MSTTKHRHRHDSPVHPTSPVSRGSNHGPGLNVPSPNGGGSGVAAPVSPINMRDDASNYTQGSVQSYHSTRSGLRQSLGISRSNEIDSESKSIPRLQSVKTLEDRSGAPGPPFLKDSPLTSASGASSAAAVPSASSRINEREKNKNHRQRGGEPAIALRTYEGATRSHDTHESNYCNLSDVSGGSSAIFLGVQALERQQAELEKKRGVPDGRVSSSRNASAPLRQRGEPVGNRHVKSDGVDVSRSSRERRGMSMIESSTARRSPNRRFLGTHQLQPKSHNDLGHKNNNNPPLKSVNPFENHHNRQLKGGQGRERKIEQRPNSKNALGAFPSFHPPPPTSSEGRTGSGFGGDGKVGFAISTDNRIGVRTGGSGGTNIVHHSTDFVVPGMVLVDGQSETGTSMISCNSVMHGIGDGGDVSDATGDGKEDRNNRIKYSGNTGGPKNGVISDNVKTIESNGTKKVRKTTSLGKCLRFQRVRLTYCVDHLVNQLFTILSFILFFITIY